MKKKTVEKLILAGLVIFMIFHWMYLLKKFECNNVDCYKGPVQAEDSPETGYGE